MNKNKVLIFGSNATLSKEIIKLLVKKFEIIKINKKILNFDEKKMHLKVNYILNKYNPDVVINSSGVLGNNLDLYEKDL